MYFKELYIIFKNYGHKHTFEDLKISPLEIINSKYMENLSKKCYSRSISQLIDI